MTREETIKFLNTFITFGKVDCTEEEAKECMIMAVKALEQLGKEWSDYMLPIELKEFLHNIKDHDFDMCGQYKVDKNEADKVIKQLDRLDSIFVNADEIKPDDEIFKDDYSEKNTQNGWILCEDRLPNINEWVLCHCQANIKEILRLTCDGWYKDNSHCYMESFVIAWQPLPKWEKVI